MRRLTIIAGLAGALAMLGVGCISFGPGGGGTSPGADGGVFKTVNKGEVWNQKGTILTAGADVKSITGLNVVSLAQDPQDPNALYAGTDSRGLFFSYDGGESWQQANQLTNGRVSSIAVHPKSKCTVYATFGNRLLRSVDCSRSWDVVYFDTRTERQITSVLIDHFDPTVIWAGTDGGDVLKSTDGARSWTSLNTFKSGVRKLAMSASDSRRVIAATQKSGLWRTDDGGENWTDLTPGYREHTSSVEFYDMAIGVSDPGVVVMASRFGMLRSSDFGDTWEAVELLTPPRSTLLYSVAVDPKDANAVYYGTATTFYSTPNGGTNWTPRALPTSRAATVLLVDGSNSNVLYMGVTKFKN